MSAQFEWIKTTGATTSMIGGIFVAIAGLLGCTTGTVAVLKPRCQAGVDWTEVVFGVAAVAYGIYLARRQR
jgi:hypothetical protein